MWVRKRGAWIWAQTVWPPSLGSWLLSLLLWMWAKGQGGTSVAVWLSSSLTNCLLDDSSQRSLVKMCWELNSHTWGSRPQALPQGTNRKLNAQENTTVTFVSPQNCRALGSLQSTFSEPPNGPGRWAGQVQVESCQQQAGEPGGIPSRIAQAQDQKQSMFLVQSEGRKGPTSQLKGPQAGWVSLHSRRGNIFALVGSSADWVEPTHTREGHGFTRYVFKCPSHPETSSQTHPEEALTKGLGTCGPVTLTCKSNCHVHWGDSLQRCEQC